MIDKMKADLLYEKYEEAMNGMYMNSGIWTVESSSCTQVVGHIEDAHGREVEVVITIQADTEEWIDKGEEEEIEEED